MKAKIYSLLAVLMAVVGLTACDDWTPDSQFDKNSGGVSFSEFALDVKDQPTVVSRAVPDVNDFLVTIVNPSTGKVVTSNGKECSWTYGTMPEVMTLRVGSYRVVVKSHVPEAAAWDAPYFEGSEDFEVKEGLITSIGTVVARFASVKVEVKFSDLLMRNMADDCKVTVVAGENGTLTWTKAETRLGYFDASSRAISLVATFEGTVKGSSQRSVQEFTEVTGGKYYIISYKMASGDPSVPDENGGADPAGITVNGEIEEQGEGGDVPGGGDTPGGNGRPDDEEWGDDPNPPGPDNPDDPKEEMIIFDTVNNGSALQLGPDKTNPTSANPATVDIYAKKGIAHLNVKIESTSAEFLASAGDMIPLEFDLVEKSSDPESEDYDTFYVSLGLPVGDMVKGKGIDSPVVFDVTGLVPLLNAFPGKHTFNLSVTDTDGNTKSDVLIFVAQ